MSTQSKLLIGAHVSITGGFYKAIEEGSKIGCTAIQIFTKSNRQWASKPISKEEAQFFIQTQKKSNIALTIAHASYLINLGSANEETKQKSYAALIDEIKRCDQLQIPYLVLHPGTADVNEDKETSIKKTGKLIEQALEETKNCSTTVLVETMAGQGKSIGSAFEELGLILKQISHKKRIGVCFDTCHAFAAGYNFATKKNYNAMMELFDTTIGIQYLKMFHMNDSKKERGCKVDRHEHIGAGSIPLESFSFIMNDPRWSHVPKILETPKDEHDGILQDQKNLKTLCDLIQ